MRSSNLPGKLFVSATIFVIAACWFSACTSKTMVAPDRDAEPPARHGSLININTANAHDLQDLPQVGPVLAAKIIEHRDRYGPFRRPEDVLIVDGVSETRFYKFRRFIDTK